LLNTAEAARFLRVSQASIRRWSDSGQLPSRRVGGRRERRFKESDLAAFLDSQATTNSATGVVVGGIVVAAPAHLATFYSTDTGLLRVTLPFLAEGLRLGEPCVLVATGGLLSRYVEALGRQDGVELERAQDSGLFTTAQFADGTAAEAIAEWEQRLSQLIARGARSIRIAGEMVSERAMFASEDEMLRYEEAFELMSKRYPVVVICQYDVREFDGVAILRAIKAHPDMFDFRIGAFLN